MKVASGGGEWRWRVKVASEGGEWRWRVNGQGEWR